MVVEKVLVTGSSGFIGMHLCRDLLNDGYIVKGIDNMNNYYSLSLKKARLKKLLSNHNFTFSEIDITNPRRVEKVFNEFKPDMVVNLAAQAGVRYSIENPLKCINTNIVGFTNIIQSCLQYNVGGLIYASSSSVYGGNEKIPFSTDDRVDKPISIYAASKKSNELMAHSYSNLYKLPTTGLRFFTVYGPWGRPDMALFKFTDSIFKDKPIEVFNNGNMVRDFTFIDDIVEGLKRVIDKTPNSDKQFNHKNPKLGSSWAPYKIFNIGNSNPTPLMDYINSIEKAIGKKAKINFKPMQMGDVQCTSANTKALEEWIDFKPNTSIDVGISKFIAWYRDFYSCSK
mgnify:CR=1 FL=1